MTTFEPCGYRAKRTGSMVPNLDTVRAFGVRGNRGRRMKDSEWQSYVEANYEVVYRISTPVDKSVDALRGQALGVSEDIPD